MRFDGYHHIGLIVDDVATSLKFYTEGLGGNLIFSFPMGDTGKNIYLVDLGGNAVIEIIPLGNENAEKSARWEHIALRTDDVSEAFNLSLRAGADSFSEPADVNLGTMPVRNAFVTGPDGELIEFFQEK